MTTEQEPQSKPAPPAPTPPTFAEALGRRAARLAKAARPRLERLAAESTPRIQQTSREAIQYAREHQDELRQAATKLARARIRGPLGPLVDAIASNVAAAARREPAARGLCGACGQVNPAAARFCNQCGAQLPLQAAE